MHARPCEMSVHTWHQTSKMWEMQKRLQFAFCHRGWGGQVCLDFVCQSSLQQNNEKEQTSKKKKSRWKSQIPPKLCFSWSGLIADFNFTTRIWIEPSVKNILDLVHLTIWKVNVLKKHTDNKTEYKNDSLSVHHRRSPSSLKSGDSNLNVAQLPAAPGRCWIVLPSLHVANSVDLWEMDTAQNLHK